MTIYPRILLTVTLISALSSLTSCSSTGRGVLPQGGPTMAQIYQQKMQDAEAQNDGLDTARNKADAGWSGTVNTNPYGYTRTANNELNNLFPKLPNPTVVMYVYPHLAGTDEAPIPGYATAFTVYKEDYFALPGEVAGKGY